ncbi:hypothetical protein NVS55_37085 [Myxococcus stipitatus]|uniref:hypothetical protein n=1 Tax=Myxococcus stipitatus TaxID=83455 RepID=UPI0031450A52
MFSRPDDGAPLRLRAVARVAVLTALLSALPASAGCLAGGAMVVVFEVQVLAGLAFVALFLALYPWTGHDSRELVVAHGVSALVTAVLGVVFDVLNESNSLAVFWGGGVMGFVLLGWYRFTRTQWPVRPQPPGQQLL